MVHDKIRTTSFRLKDEEFGQVYAYTAGDRFNSIWQELKQRRNRPYLPYASLSAALSVLSGDFVRLSVKPYFAVSRKRLSRELLSRALNAWEYAVFPNDADGRLAGVSDDLTESCLHVAEYLGSRNGACPSPPSWVWEVGGWEVAHRLASRPLRTDDKLLRLRVDTGASTDRVGLVTWDQPIEIGGDKRREPARAMIRILPRLISIPGLNGPVIHLQSSITRLADKWSWVKSAWANLRDDLPLLLSAIGREKVDDVWQSVWIDQTVAVLGALGLKALLEPSAIDLASIDLVRARAGVAPAGYPIGKGTGQKFHDAVAVHAQALLQDAEPVQLSRAVRSLPMPAREEMSIDNLDLAIAASGNDALRIVCLYATDATRRRMVDAIGEAVKGSNGSTWEAPADDQIATIGRMEVLFTSPQAAAEHLMQYGDEAGIESWLRSALPTLKHDTRGRIAALVETIAEEDRRDNPSGDPKHILRRALAKAGITSQFLSPSSAPDPDRKKRRPSEDLDSDYAAERAVWDLLRSAGIFPRPFPPSGKRIPAGTWALGLFAKDVKQSSKRGPRGASRDSFAISLVAVELGTRQACALQPNGNWAPLGIATAGFLADEKTFLYENAKEHIESALSRFIAEDPLRNAILFVEAVGCRRFWSGFADTGDNKLFRAVDTGRLAVVRVRSHEDEVPRPAGVGEWPEDGVVRDPRVTDGLLRLEMQDWEGAWFYISASKTMRQQGAHREHTRHSDELSKSELRKDWHALTLTEFWCRHPGPFEMDAVYELAARLCREAPTWDGTLNWPSPVHLAKAMLEDHPAKYFKDFAAEGRDGVN